MTSTSRSQTPTLLGKFSYLFALLAVSTVDDVSGFSLGSVGRPWSPTSSSRSSCLRLGLDASPEVAVQTFLDVLSEAKSPTDVLTRLPTAAVGVAAAPLAIPAFQTATTVVKSFVQLAKDKTKKSVQEERRGYRTYPEGQPATYELNTDVVPFEFGDAALVRPLLKQTQLETRKLQVVYDANRHGYNPQSFHSKVDGKGAAVVLAKVNGQWCGGYNPRGWASLGSPRSSVAAFLFRQTLFGGWEKVRVSRTGSMACGNDLYDAGIYFGADSLVIPLRKPNEHLIKSRLGQYFETRSDGKTSILPARAGEDLQVQELKILTGVYAPGEGTWHDHFDPWRGSTSKLTSLFADETSLIADIPNSGGVLELGQF